VGWCNDVAARCGLKRGWPRRLQNFLTMGALLLGLTLGAEVFALNRYPDATALLLAAVLCAAVLAGLVFRGRVFCRYLCPIGGMVGLYSRLAPEEVGTRNQEICRRCESKACYHGSERWYRLALLRWKATFAVRRPGCPAFVFPPEAAGNASCLQCTQCFKNCPYDNLRWGAKWPLSGLWQVRTRDRSEALLVVVLTGIVFYRLARFWSALREGVEWPATFAATHIGAIGPAGFKALKLGAGFLLWPVLFFLLLAALAKLAAETRLAPLAAAEPAAPGIVYGEAEVDAERLEEDRGWEVRRHSVRGYLATYCFSFIPLLAGAYAAFAIIKLNEKLGYLPLALADPAGVRTSLALNQLQILTPPESLLPLPLVRWAALAAVAAGAVVAVWSAGRVGAAVYGAGSRPAVRGSLVFRGGLTVLSGLFLFCLKTWLFRG
ncbi:MAG TPA: 4Fe-4S binding protein, partial [Candidatus Methanoperedens sp.]|nr:4Fe-4S binding protein [Candidatus Methanoperedens sp.]